MKTLEELLSYHSFKRIPKEMYPTRVYNILKELGFDLDNQKYIHITGSKGKGSLAFNTFSVLRQQHKVGLFTSPHIIDIKERFIINDSSTSDDRLNQITQTYKPYFSDLHFFEICLFIALVYFLEEKCDYIILEVGIGGRFDPTNFCQPILALFGHISIEHRDFLGATIEEIAFDKAGIIKKNIPALSVDQSDIVTSILKREGTVYFFSDIICIDNYQQIGNYQQFDLSVRFPDKELSIPNIQLNRIGQAHLINFALAIAGTFLAIPDMDIQWVYQSMKEKFAYRLDMITPNIMIDTAHNGASFRNLLLALKQMNWQNIILYITILEGKELQDIVDQLISFKEIIHHIEFFEFNHNHSKKSDAISLYKLSKDYIPCVYHHSITSIKLDGNKKQIFAGSFYSIPDVLEVIKTQKD